MKKIQVIDEPLLNLLRRHKNTCMSVNRLNKSLRSIAKHTFGIRVGSRKKIFSHTPESFTKQKDEELFMTTMSVFIDTVSSLAGFECTYRYMGTKDGEALNPCIIIERAE